MTNFAEFVTKIWFQRLGAEASAGAIADMYENHDALRIRYAYLTTSWFPNICELLSDVELEDFFGGGGDLYFIPSLV